MKRGFQPGCRRVLVYKTTGRRGAPAMRRARVGLTYGNQIGSASESSYKPRPSWDPRYHRGTTERS